VKYFNYFLGILYLTPKRTNLVLRTVLIIT